MTLRGPMARSDAEDIASLLIRVTRSNAGDWFVVNGSGTAVRDTEAEATEVARHFRERLVSLLIGELPRLVRAITPSSFAAYLTKRGWEAGTSKRSEILRFHPPQNGCVGRRGADDFHLLIPATTDFDDYAECVLRAAGCLRQIEGRPIGDILRDAAPAQEGDQHVQVEG